MAPKGICSLKLLQVNIWGGKLEKQLIALLQAETADIVCLQESVSIPGGAVFVVTVEQLQKSCGYMYAYSSPVISFGLMGKEAQFGNTILSKVPFSETDTIFTRLQHKSNFNFDTDDYNIRNLQHVIVTVDGQRVHILNHHGHHIPGHKDGDLETERQCEIIAQKISELDGPVILTGDFNLAPHSKSLEQINRSLRNLSIEAGLRTTRTQLTQKKEVCDYIFVNNDIHVQSFRALDDLVSDHKALVLEFDC